MNLGHRLLDLRRKLRVGSLPKLVRRLAAPVWRLLLARLTVIAITGSCGKTTTTTLTGKLLAECGPTNIGVTYNTLPSINVAMLRNRFRHRWHVQEISATAPGTIRQMTLVLRPQIGIVTLVGSDHWSNYRSADAIAEEKANLVRCLPADGLAILNADDPRVLAMKEWTRARVMTFGLAEGADLRATSVSGAWPERLTLTVSWQGQSRRIQTRLVGEFWVASILPALLCALHLGVPFDTAAKVIEGFEPLPYRNMPHEIPGGPVFIDDSSNTSPH